MVFKVKPYHIRTWLHFTEFIKFFGMPNQKIAWLPVLTKENQIKIVVIAEFNEIGSRELVL